MTLVCNGRTVSATSMFSENLPKNMQLMAILLILLSLYYPADSSSSYLQYSTNEIWTKSGITYRRPSWSGNVTILYDESQIWNVFGIILPISTSDRPSAPNPYNGYDTGTALSLDKGHLMALSNGGPDIKRNIVPQSSSWQQHGGWRDLEEVIFDYALSKYGWDPDAIYHASEVHDVADPGRWNYVTFNLSIFDYDNTTGQPMRYRGTVQSKSDLIYQFTISPENDAVWDRNITPPSNATFVISTSNPTAVPTSAPSIGSDETEETFNSMSIALVATAVLLIILLGGTSVLLLRRKKKLQKQVDYDVYNKF